MKVKKIVAIHDLSGFGRASLTIAIPVLSRMGHRVCPLPTAVLSAQTLYSGYKITDLTKDIAPFTEHWQEMGLSFDCIYSGFLASTEQIDLVSCVVDKFKTEKTLTVIDPVMGDDGKTFSLFDGAFVDRMRTLVKKADIITPNFTEAGLLLGYSEFENQNLETAKIWRKELAGWGIETVVITSVPTDEKHLCTLAYSKTEDKFYFSHCEKFPVHYSGTGDTYTSVLVGALLRKNSLEKSLSIATDFLSHCIRESYLEDPKDLEFQLEQHLNKLITI